MNQLQLVPPDTIQARFEEFDRANPWVYDRLVGMTRGLVERGRRKVGMKMLFEVLRWEYAMSTSDPASDFKLNNNYASRYARQIMDREPDLDEIFDTRELTAW